MLACKAVAVFYRINKNVAAAICRKCSLKLLFLAIIRATRDSWTVLVDRVVPPPSRLPFWTAGLSPAIHLVVMLQRFVRCARPRFSPLPSGAAVPVSAIYIVIPSPRGSRSGIKLKKSFVRSSHSDEDHTYVRRRTNERVLLCCY